MLGEKIGEFTGKTTGTRVLPQEGHGPKMEVSMQQTGRLLGVEVTDMGTYTSELQPGGYLNGKGQGIIMTKDGEAVTWTGAGIGRPTGKGMAVSWRGSLHYQTMSGTSTKLSRLNGQCVLFEYDVDENGHTTGRLTEWK